MTLKYLLGSCHNFCWCTIWYYQVVSSSGHTLSSQSPSMWLSTETGFTFRVLCLPSVWGRMEEGGVCLKFMKFPTSKGPKLRVKRKVEVEVTEESTTIGRGTSSILLTKSQLQYLWLEGKLVDYISRLVNELLSWRYTLSIKFAYCTGFILKIWDEGLDDEGVSWCVDNSHGYKWVHEPGLGFLVGTEKIKERTGID